MKKKIIKHRNGCIHRLFAACSEEEIISTQNGTPKEVTVTAQIPAGAATRNVGVDNVINDNQLRCILSVVNNQDKSEITRRKAGRCGWYQNFIHIFGRERHRLQLSVLGIIIDLNANEAEQICR